MISSLVGVVTKVMSDVFPELKQYESKIQEIIADEEASFGRTLLKVFLIFFAYDQHSEVNDLRLLLQN